MDLKRTLQSYRLTPADTLILTQEVTVEVWKQKFQQSSDVSEILVIISSPEYGCQKTMKVALKDTFETVMRQFISKTKIKALPYFFNLYLHIPGVCSEMMNPDEALESFPLPNPVCFSFVCFYKELT